MWVITLDGFFSVVQKNKDKNTETVQVRGRLCTCQVFPDQFYLATRIVKRQCGRSVAI